MERESEYIKDRLEKQIRSLMRENSMLKESLFCKDREIIDAQNKLHDANQTASFMSVALGIILLVLIIGTLAAVRYWGGAP